MKVRRVDHITINTTDITASIEFYRDVVGFRQMETVPFGGFSLVYFEKPGGARMELFDYSGKNPRNAPEESEAGVRHLAFSVEDVDEAERH